MGKAILSLTILCYFIFLGQGWAAASGRANYYYFPNGLATATGTIQAISRNSIVIYDEQQKRQGRFFYFEQGEEFHQGEYVRIYYNPMGKVVQRIKRMTVLEYNVNGQNLGYISR